MTSHRMSMTAVKGARRRGSGVETLARLAMPAATVKAIDAMVQGLTGLMLVIIPSSVLSGPANTLATRDMITDPQHLFARHIASAAERTLAADHHMMLIYGLFAVAVVKLVLATGVLLRMRGALTAALLGFGALALYELVQVVRSGGPLALTVLTALDVAVVVILTAQLVTVARHRG